MNQNEVSPIALDDYYLFKSCVAGTVYPSIELSVKYVLDRIKANYTDDPKQSSCTGFGVYIGVVPLETNLALNARNLSLAAETTTKNVVCTCPSCYNNLKHCQKLLSKEKTLEKQTKIVLKKIGRNYNIDPDIYHVSDVFLSRINDINKKTIKHPLSGIRAVTHHGCHYAKFFFKDIISGTFEQPTVLDRILELMGCDVIDYSEQFLCCGGGLHSSLIEEEYNINTLKRKFKSINKVKPDIIITMCPNCSFNFDHYQKSLENELDIEEYIPVLYISELLALLMGANMEDLGIDIHAVSLNHFIGKLKVKK
jgi:heterodisulfide reductase subunit B1